MLLFLFLTGCKVTTFFRKLYQLPMENLRAEEKHKLLQTSLLNKRVCNSLWKTFSRNLIYCAIKLTAKPPPGASAILRVCPAFTTFLVMV